MGRYYNGDIGGKFWFAVQPSDAADRFGVTGSTNTIEYYFDESNLPDVQKELKSIEEKLGDNLEKIKNFFEKEIPYNDEVMQKEGLDPKVWQEHQKDYADYILGKKIEECIIDTGECGFSAEL